MTRTEYWKECIAQAAESCGLVMTAEQVDYMADAVQGGDENIGQAFYMPESQPDHEKKELQRKLKAEQEKQVCHECKGTGTEVIHGPHHSGISQCWKCRGEGKCKP